jgi:hypothetical protein
MPEVSKCLFTKKTFYHFFMQPVISTKNKIGCIMLSTHFFKKLKKKARQENRKWTFLKCPK